MGRRSPGMAGVPPAVFGILPDTAEHIPDLASCGDRRGTRRPAGATPAIPAERVF